jgi:hypothetical protein
MQKNYKLYATYHHLGTHKRLSLLWTMFHNHKEYHTNIFKQSYSNIKIAINELEMSWTNIASKAKTLQIHAQRLKSIVF